MNRNSLLLLLLVAPAAVFAKGESIDKVNGAIRTEAGTEYGSLETVNGSIEIAEGVIADSAETVNGGIEVEDRASIGKVETVNGGIDVGADAVIERTVVTVNGGVRLGRNSEVGGKVETVNGGISLTEARIGDGIATVNGSIDVGAKSVVRGGILVEKPNGWFNWGTSRKPRIVIGPNAVVDGELRFEHEVELYVHDTAKIGPVSGATAVKFSGEQP